MAMGYRPVVRDKEFLLPPRMTDWLADDHLVWFVLDVFAELDTARLHERAARRRDGRPVRNTAGRAGYDPDMLLALLIYGMRVGSGPAGGSSGCAPLMWRFGCCVRVTRRITLLDRLTELRQR